MKKSILLSVAALLFFANAFAQSVGISNNSAAPDNSAMLDVKSSNKGMLIPRVALTGTNDIATIPSPATSLLVYNTAATTGTNAVTPGFYYWSGSAWVMIITVAGSTSNAWLTKGNTGTIDGTSFIGTTDNVPFNVRVNNQKAGRIDSAKGNTFWGYRAGDATTTGFYNTANGYKALYSDTTGDGNTANGFQALYSNTTGSYNTADGAYALENNTTGFYNTAIGVAALENNTTGYLNTANGNDALYNNTTGDYNTANGASALNSNTTGSYNTANGNDALYNNTTGNYNTANGASALNSNTTGGYNTANGAYSLRVNSTGNYNTANGYKALNTNTSGGYNTANGYYALYSNTVGFFNTAIGLDALYNNTTGGANTAIGQEALYNNTTGSYNTALGYGTNVSSGALTNTTAIGYNAYVNASNKIRLGNTFVTVIEGQVAYTYPSDARFKYSIHHDVPGLAFIKKLTPVTYYFDEQKLDEYTKTGILNNSSIHSASYSKEKQLHTGFLAQDVEKVAKELGYAFDGVHAPANNKDHYSIAYSQFIMPLVKAVQEQQQIIESQNSDIEILKTQVAELTKLVSTLSHK